MSGKSTPMKDPPGRRPYDSPVRRQQAAATRERIVAAGSALVHSFPTWDWSDLTFRAVAERAGVSQRTVYRHFATERDLHAAVLRRLEEEAGVSYKGLELDDLAAVTARVFASLSSFAASAVVIDVPTLLSADQERRDALLDAVSRQTGNWSAGEREMVAAMLDVLWGLPSYERLVTQWKMDAEQATAAITWVIGLVRDAVRAGLRPPA